MGKWLKNILGLVIVAYLLWYLSNRWDQLSAILQITPVRLGCMYLICLLTSLVSARVVKQLLSSLDAPTRFWDMACLQNAAILLNYAPMKLGTVFRANYLKRHYGLAYTHFATFFLYITFLMTLIAALIGLVMLLIGYGLATYEIQVMAGVFAVAILLSFAILMLPIPVPRGENRLSSTLRSFLQGRKKISLQHRQIVVSSLLLMVNFVLTAFRLAIIYSSLGQDIHPGGYIVLGSLAFVVLFVGLTPGGLGIKELTLTFGAVVLGVSPDVAVLAAMMDRAVTVTYAFGVGGLCAGYLWRKSPADFKANSTATSEQ